MKRVKEKIRIASDALRNMRIETRPFYVTSHERSGTHFLINSINANFPIRVGYGLGKGAGHGWNNIGEWFGPYENKADRYLHIEHYNQVLWEKGVRRNAVIKSHADHVLFKKKFRSAPVIYIYRNPVDVMASWFHYLNKDEYYLNNPAVEDMRSEKFSEFLRRPVNEFLRYSFSEAGRFKNVVERWAEHTSGWLSDETACCVRYEDLKNNPDAVLGEISKYLNVPRSGDTSIIDIGNSKSILPRKGNVGDGAKYCGDGDVAFIRECIERYDLKWDTFNTSA